MVLLFHFSVTDNPLMESKDNVSDYETTTIKNEPLSDTEEEDHSNQPVIGGYRSEDSASERLLGEVTISTKSEVSNNDQRLTETTKVKYWVLCTRHFCHL